MPERISTTLDLVLLGIVNLLTPAVFPVTYITLQPQPLNVPPSTIWCSVVPGSPKFNQGIMGGAGVSGIQVTIIVTVFAWCKLSTDIVQRQDNYLTDPSLGVIAAWNQMLNALAIVDLTNSAGDLILSQPMRPIASDLKITNIPGFGFMTTGIEVVYNTINPGQLSA